MTSLISRQRTRTINYFNFWLRKSGQFTFTILTPQLVASTAGTSPGVRLVTVWNEDVIYLNHSTCAHSVLPHLQCFHPTAPWLTMNELGNVFSRFQEEMFQKNLPCGSLDGSIPKLRVTWYRYTTSYTKRFRYFGFEGKGTRFSPIAAVLPTFCISSYSCTLH